MKSDNTNTFVVKEGQGLRLITMVVVLVDVLFFVIQVLASLSDFKAYWRTPAMTAGLLIFLIIVFRPLWRSFAVDSEGFVMKDLFFKSTRVNWGDVISITTYAEEHPKLPHWHKWAKALVVKTGEINDKKYRFFISPRMSHFQRFKETLLEKSPIKGQK